MASQLLASQILLFVAPVGNIPDCLIFAIEREFPWIMVRQVPDLSAACATLDHPVRLILIDTAFLDELGARSTELVQYHKGASIALIHDRGACSMHDVFALKIVRGVVTMNLKLDVWLSVISLLFQGGEHFPAAMFQPYFDDRPSASIEIRPSRSRGVDAGDLGPEELAQLTERETQILEMVSRGLQNKVIAAALHLSEHTVKIHLHNIIRKLGAHNRTEAAAIFHEHRASCLSFAAARSPA